MALFLKDIQMNLNHSFYFQKGLSFCADNDIFSSSRFVTTCSPCNNNRSECSSDWFRAEQI